MPLDRAETLELVSDASNFAVVRMPGRRFPGCVIQGDTLSILHSDLRGLEEQIRSTLGDRHELAEEAGAIAARLHERLWWYEQELKRAGYTELPYSESVGMPDEGRSVV